MNTITYLKDYEKAIAPLLKGNALKRETFDFSLDSEMDYFENLQKIFTEKLFVQHKSVGSRDASPIFVLGMPRSGTSLVEQILASHPDVHGAGELSDLDRVIVEKFARTEDAIFASKLSQASSGDF